MGYTFTCDDCGTRYDHAPPFMGELRESFIKTSDSPLVDLYGIGETLTMCRECAERRFL